MYQNTLIALLTLFSFSNSYAQVKKDVKKDETKMDIFSSKTGVIVKFVDYKLSAFKVFLSEPIETRIRKVISGGITQYFYQIEKHSEYGNSVASIEYNDLLEVLKAFQVLKTESSSDAASKPDYLENKFTTSDGFQIGYYVDGNKIKWYLHLERYSSNSTVFINDADNLESRLQEAKSKIEELSK